MEKAENKLIFLGSSWDILPLLFDLAYETLKISSFIIVKNIKLEGTPNMLLNTGFYHYELKEPEEPFLKTNSPVFWGLCGPRNKYKVFQDFLINHNIQELDYINLVHPTAYIATSSELSSGILLEPLSVISSQSKIEFGVTIKRGVKIGHHNQIGAFTDINPGVVLSGMVQVGKGCILGTGTVVKDGITIGDNSYIGMGSVVTKDVPPNVIAYGNPCKVMKENDLWSI